jgi:serine protease Do
VTIQDLDENTAKALGLAEPSGALITTVMEGDPAAKAGVLVGDVVTEVGGKPVKDSNGLLRAIASIKPGEKAELTVWRKGKSVKLAVTLGQRDGTKLAKSQPGGKEETPARNDLGLSLRLLKPEEAKALGISSGKGLMVTEVVPGSPAEEVELKPGDVILEVNQTAVSSVAEFNKILEQDARKKGVVLLLIKRGQQNLFRTVPLPEKK